MRTIKNTVEPFKLAIVAGLLHTGLATYSSVASQIGFDARNVSRWFNSQKFIESTSPKEFKLTKDVEASNLLVGEGTVIIVDKNISKHVLTLTGTDSILIALYGSDIEELYGEFYVGDDGEVVLPVGESILYVGGIIGNTGELEVIYADETPKKSVVKVVETEEDDFKNANWEASSKFISIISNKGEIFSADSSHEKFKEALALLVEDDIFGAVCLINTKKGIEKFVKGDIRIEGSQLFFKDVEIVSGLATRIIDSYHKDEDITSLINFLNKVMENPTRKTVYRLFDFLKANDIEITEDGHFLAWKMVRSNFKDIYTNTMDNSVGNVVEMSRYEVQDDDNITCSNGLHVCSKGYLNSGFGSGDHMTLRVKVHPADVVSIPTDYNDAKMRVCKYYVDSVVDKKDIV